MIAEEVFVFLDEEDQGDREETDEEKDADVNEMEDYSWK